MDKSPDAFPTISEAAEDLDLPQHVLRFWETRFPQIKPLKRGGGRRYYRPDDVELLRVIKQLLYGEGYTIKGVQKLFREQAPPPAAAPTQTHTISDADASPPPSGQAGFVGGAMEDDAPDAPHDRAGSTKSRTAPSFAGL